MQGPLIAKSNILLYRLILVNSLVRFEGSESIMRILIVGSTGLVGGEVLKLALNNVQVSSVVAPTRRPLPAHPKLAAPLVDFDHLPENEDWWQVDAVICALGTTIKTAGSKEAFAQVDLAYPLQIATIARKHGVPTFLFNSAIGANASSKFFYNRIKGQAEHELAKFGFSSLILVRPGLIGGDRQESRMGESIGKVITKLLHPLLPAKYHINPAERIAEAMLTAALQPPPGVTEISSEQLI